MDHPEWPGPRNAEKGTSYVRTDPEGEFDLFVVDEVRSRDDGAAIVSGRWQTL